MFKITGILVIVNAFVIAACWLTGEHSHKGWVFMLFLAAVFVGTFLILQDRVTALTIKGIGTIKSAAEQATSDANNISELKKRIEAQSATVDLVAQKATETIGQLKSIACTNAKANITDLMASNFGFTDGLNLKSRIELHDRIITSLKEIGVSEAEIKVVDGMWNKGVGVIYFRGIRDALEGRTTPNIINKDASPELLRASKEFQKLLNFENWETPTPDEMESFIEAKGFMNDEVKELLKDYRHFLITGEILRREIFEKL